VPEELLEIKVFWKQNDSITELIFSYYRYRYMF